METFATVFPEACLYAGSLDPSRQVVALISKAATAAEIETARLTLGHAGVLDDPLLAAKGIVSALKLGDIRLLVPKIAAALDSAPQGIQRDDRPWVEFDGPRARARGRLIRATRFRALVASADAIRHGASRLTGADFAIRAVWNPQRARRLFPRALANREAHPITARMAWKLSQDASRRGDPREAGEMAAYAARASQGEQRISAASRAIHQFAQAGASDRGDAVLRELLGNGPLDARNAPLALEGAQLALSNKDPERAIAWLMRMKDVRGPVGIAGLVVLAMAEDARGDPKAAKKALILALTTSAETTWKVLAQAGATPWAEALSGKTAPQ
jgi:hypothetical protein